MEKNPQPPQKPGSKFTYGHFISGLIGGASALFLSMVLKRVTSSSTSTTPAVIKTLLEMKSAQLPAAIGPYSKGKIISLENGQHFMAFTSG